MRNTSILFLGLLVMAVLLAYMVTYTVSFNEMAVVTTFGRADETSVRNKDGTGVGLNFKWPRPIQHVRTFDRRVQVFESRLEDVQTADRHNVVVSVFVMWQIDDPLAFARAMPNTDFARQQLDDRVRDAKGILSRYTFDQLASEDPERLQLAEAEDAIRDQLVRQLTSHDRGGAAERDTGIRVIRVGIKRVLLPAQVTEQVFARMRENRQRLAQRARSEGDAAASAIRARAESAARGIATFADLHADAIRADGAAAAARHYATFEQNEDFAIFLRKLAALRESLRENSTILLDTRLQPFDLFGDPDAPRLEADAVPVPADDGSARR